MYIGMLFFSIFPRFYLTTVDISKKIFLQINKMISQFIIEGHSPTFCFKQDKFSHGNLRLLLLNILLQEEMRSSKKIFGLKNSTKNPSPKSSSIHFRTIFKARIDSTLPQTDLQHSDHSQKVKSISQASCRSSSLSASKPKQPFQREIKDYVRQMKMKREGDAPRPQTYPKQETDMRQSRLSSSSKISNSLGPREIMNQSSKQITLQQIEKRIESLLASKLKKLKLYRSGIGLSTWQFLKKENQLEPELQEIIVKLRDERQGEEGISQLSTKLQLIEKMIASEVIESELLKGRYFGFKNQRCNISSHHNKKLLATASSFNQSPQLRTSTYRSLPKAEALSKYSTANQQSFIKPAKQYYVNSRYKHPAYVPNRQILPRSSYSTEFLRYGSMPTFQNRQGNTDCLPSHSLAVKASTYQQQFKDKYNLTTNINFKELDCYKNKFKNPNISFMSNCKKKMLDNVTNLKKSTKLSRETAEPQSKLAKMLSHSTFSDFYKTENKRNYLGHSASQSELSSWMKGQPKDAQLNNLKEALRTSFIRG